MKGVLAIFVVLSNGVLAGSIEPHEPTLSISDAVTSEGNQATVVFTVTLTGASSVPVSVNWVTEPLTATEDDYIGDGGTVDFPPSNEASRTVRIAVPVLVDQHLEGAETFYVRLYGAVNARIGDHLAHGVIKDDAAPLAKGKGDFSNDGRSDLVVLRIQHHAGTRTDPPIYHKNHIIIIKVESTIGTSGPSVIGESPWRTEATGDFNGDGRCDLFWAHDVTKELAVTQGPHLPRPEDVLHQTSPGEGWQVVGSGDFSDDGRADVLWWNAASGELSFWISGKERFPTAVLKLEGWPDTTWKPVAVAQIDLDSRTPEIVWQREAGLDGLVYWRMQWIDGKLVHDGGGDLEPSTDRDLEVVGAGDFDGDGFDDLLWQHRTSGSVSVWFMMGPVRRHSSLLSPERFDEVDPETGELLEWRVVGPR